VPKLVQHQEGATAEQMENAALAHKRSKRIVQYALAGNLAITSAKAFAWLTTGSSAMMSESIHSMVDSGNQALLLVALDESNKAQDKSHQYGYGKNVYFWSLVSALGTFWCGAGVAMWTSVHDLVVPALEIKSVGWETWGVLSVSLAIDGWVLTRTIQEVNRTRPPGVSFLKHCRSLRDPVTAAVLLEDGAACAGILMAGAGIGLTHMTEIVAFDGVAGVSVSLLLGYMGVYLARLNQVHPHHFISTPLKQILFFSLPLSHRPLFSLFL
jgi:zinc transporter 9